MSSSRSRPPSITRSVRESFNPEMELLPPEKEFSIIHTSGDEETTISFSDEELVDTIDDNRDDQILSDSSGDNTYIKREAFGSSNFINNVDEEDKMAIKIRKGIEKIKKLDKVLASKLEFEKELKKERLHSEKKFANEVQTLVAEKGSESFLGYKQLLSLCVPVDRSEDLAKECTEDIKPIFTTQIEPDYYQDSGKLKNVITPTNSNHRQPFENDKNKASSPGRSKHRSEKDFIRRNIQLAAQGSEYGNLTESEKKRLRELLADDDHLLIGENPFSDAPKTLTDGFQYSIEAQKTIENIDQKLREFMPSEEYEAILNDSQSDFSISSFSLSDSEKNPDGFNFYNDVMLKNKPECGEEVLRQGKQKRTMLQRLNEIEIRLKRLRSNSSDSEIPITSIDPDLLRQLLDGNSRLTSDSKSICESLRTNSALCESELDTLDFHSVTSDTLTIESMEDDETTISNAVGVTV